MEQLRWQQDQKKQEFLGELIHRGAYDNGYYYGERAVEVETEAVKLFGGEVACNERKYKYR